MTALDVSSPEAPGFGLRIAPFADSAEDAFFFPSDQHLRALEFMGHSLWTHARLGVVTADHGCGKSLLIRRLLRDLDERILVAAVPRHNVAAVPRHKVEGEIEAASRDQPDPQEFLLDILRQFGFPLEDNDRTDRRRLLERFLAHQAGAGRVCLLVVENPQSMSPRVLEELRALAAVMHEGARVLKLLLLGQPSLDLVLGSPRMSELGVCSAPHFSLGPLSEDQTAAYVAHRLRAAGAGDPDALMPATLMSRIHACARGVPARINRLCERALESAAELGAPRVTSTALDDAIEQLGWTERISSQPADALAAVGHRPKLLISLQGQPDREVTLEAGRLLIGRGAQVDIRIESVFVSRYHALIVHNEGRDLMIDLGSTNGLIVNSRRVVRHALRHRDVIQVGPAKVIYLYEGQTQAAEPDPGETVCFARPGFPVTGIAEEAGGVLALVRQDGSNDDLRTLRA